MPAQGYTPRGFGTYADFTDTYGGHVRVQQSSAAIDDCVWIFCSGGVTLPRGANPKTDTTPHLNVEQARQVRDALTEWLCDVGAELRVLDVAEPDGQLMRELPPPERPAIEH